MPENKIDRKMLGRRIAAVREYRGFSQKEVAAKVGVSQPTYSDYENGRVLMGLEKFVKLIQVLEVDADWLLGLPLGKDKGPF